MGWGMGDGGWVVEKKRRDMELDLRIVIIISYLVYVAGWRYAR